MDDAFGRAASALRATGMLRNSLIIFMSDNGGPIIPAVCNGGLRGECITTLSLIRASERLSLPGSWNEGCSYCYSVAY